MSNDPIILDMYQGERALFRVACVLPSGADDLDQSTVYFTVKQLPTDTVAAIMKTSADGGGITIPAPATQGFADVEILQNDTAALVADCAYFFDVWVKDAAGEPSFLAAGRLFIRQPITTATP